ncbi:MAG: PhzF family phenazine biosynthesis protein [Lautropia sp.]
MPTPEPASRPRTRRFIQCDVFSPVPTQGNGLAVVVDADGLDTATMQRFAAWTNLAETSFLFAPTEPDADYHVRIFTPGREMPFAGHPTLGSCAAWLHAGGTPRVPGLVRQACGVGLVDIDVTQTGVPAFGAPPTRIAALDAARRDAIVAALGIAPAQVVRTVHLDNGPVWQVLELASAEAVLAVDSARVRYPAFESIGLIGAHPTGADCAFEVRMLAPSSGMSEDPITGSLNAALAQWMRSEGRLDRPLRIAQGTVIGRQGRVHVRPAAQHIWIGGQTHVLIEGTVLL